MSKLLRIEGLTGKEESVYATDPTPTPADNGIKGIGRNFIALSPEFVFPNRREDLVSNSRIKAPPGIPAGRICGIDYTVPAIGAGVAYSSSTPVRPECDPLLMACGMSRTHVDTVSSETVTYALTADNAGDGSAALWVYGGGLLFKVLGCRGGVTFVVNAGQLIALRFQLQGLLPAGPTQVAVPAITYDSVKAPRGIGSALTLVPNGGSSWVPAVSSFEVTSNAQVQRMDDVNGADGLEGFEISGFDPKLTFQPRVVNLSAYPAYDLVAASTPHTIDATIGNTQYNRIGLDINEAYLMNDPGHSEENKFATWSPEFELQDLALAFS